MQTDAVRYHLPFGARNPEKCRTPETCNLAVHVSTVEESEELRAKRNALANSLLPPFTKKDLPLLRAAHAQGRWFMALVNEGWTHGN